MDTPTAHTRALAQRLLAAEAAGPGAAGSRVHEAVRVCEKLRVSLTRFAGADGFAALQRRALSLARAEVPALLGVTLKADGSLGGLDDLTSDTHDGRGDAAVAVIAHLLALLVTFVGEPITARLVRESWPDAPPASNTEVPRLP